MEVIFLLIFVYNISSSHELCLVLGQDSRISYSYHGGYGLFLGPQPSQRNHQQSEDDGQPRYPKAVQLSNLLQLKPWQVCKKHLQTLNYTSIDHKQHGKVSSIFCKLFQTIWEKKHVTRQLEPHLKIRTCGQLKYDINIWKTARCITSLILHSDPTKIHKTHEFYMINVVSHVDFDRIPAGFNLVT